MKPTLIFLLLATLVFTVAALGNETKDTAAASAPQAQQSPQPPAIASTVDHEISTIEKQIVEAAEAMPEDKFNFSPESLNIPGSVQECAHVCHAGQTRRRVQRFPVLGDYGRQAAPGRFQRREGP
jgi:hypothetical protein